MKIGILTQPLRTNYGGVLQAYALQRVLQEMGHEAWLVNREKRKSAFFYLGVRSQRVFDRYIRFRKGVRIGAPVPPFSLKRLYVGRRIRSFVERNIAPLREPVESTAQLRALLREGFEAFVVGSDQVWRPAYSPCITNYFLDFAEHASGIRRIAYAASFGVDTWEFPAEVAGRCAALARRFDAVSVREESGVALCREHLGVDAVPVADPTLLLDRSDYEALAASVPAENEPGELLVYVLDLTPAKRRIIASLEEYLGVKAVSVMPRERYTSRYKGSLEACSFPSVEAWLQGFRDARYVVTDSFHGTLFSLIFNKPFLTVANPERGMARFASLFERFGIEERLMPDAGPFDPSLMGRPVDFDRINRLREAFRRDSLAFLEKSLSISEF